MAGNLIIVESPHKAEMIQKFLGKQDYKVVSSKGHIRDLEEKELSIDIGNGFTPKYVIPSDKKFLVSELKKAAKEAQTVWLASDPDREGEAIAWHLADTLGLDPSRTKRITYNEITKSAVLEALDNPRDIDMNLVDAQQARRVLDRLVGFKLSPVLWRKVKRGLSAGRVQSVALRLVVDREREIAAFKSERFYRTEAGFSIGDNNVKAVLDRKFSSIDEARKFLEDSIGANYTVESVEEKEGTRAPAAPFTTSTLQQEAGRKLHFPVSTTMRVAQTLYEKGLITYMRTDSTNLSSLALGTSKQFITDNFGPEYSHPRQYKTRSKGAQEAHEAIRPTYIANTDIDGTDQEKKLYNLIWKRTVASQMAEARVLNTGVKVASDKRPEKFCLQSARVLFDGFLKLYIEGVDDGEEEEETILPEIHIGDRLEDKWICAECKFSQPPFRYSEPTLVKKLEELGIGRPSTYAPTIDTLTKGRGYIVKGDKEGTKVKVENLRMENGVIKQSSKTETIGSEKGKLLPQDIGMIVTDYLVENFSDILDYNFTANVESDFDRIADGELVWNSVISNFYTPFDKQVGTVMAEGEYAHVSREIGIDPSDGRMIVAKLGQYGPYVQKGEGPDRAFASLAKGQIIETLTLEDAVALFQLPRTVGQYNGTDIVAMKGRFGPYLKYGDRNVSIPRGSDPLKITLDACVELINQDENRKNATPVILEFPDSDITVINGHYGPYIKHAGANYKIPQGTDASALTEKACLEIIESGPAPKKFRRFPRKK